MEEGENKGEVTGLWAEDGVDRCVVRIWIGWKSLPTDVFAKYSAETVVSGDLRKGMDGIDGSVLGHGGKKPTNS